jgi:hypothetical protein
MSDTQFKPAWRKNDPALQADAIAFWCENKILPKGVAPEERAKELCGLIYRGEEVCAVSTAIITHMPSLRVKLALYRCAAARKFRRQSHGEAITDASRDLLEAWSLEHPEEGVMGMGAIIESKLLVRHMPSVFWPGGLVFIGYMPNGQQLRVAWFKHATVNPEAKRRRHGIGQVPAENS